MVNVAVHGIGTIGKRIAHAVKLQKDMKLKAIVGYSPDATIKTLLEPHGPLYGTDLYATNEESLKKFRDAKMIVNGTLEDLLKKGEIDVIIDATPEGLGKEYRDKYYSKYNVKAIFQGGEDADVAEMTFNAIVNYEKAFGKKFIRVPSCNTTGLIRTLSAIEKFGIAYVFVAIARRAADPHEYKKGPINAVEFEEVPSHHGEDVRTVLTNLNIFTMAIKVPTTLAHTHMVEATLMKKVSKEDIIKAFEDQTRVVLLDMKEYPATSKIIEKFRDYCRPRNDMYEIVVLRDSISVEGNKVRWMQVVHQEADVIPENIDAIRAITGIENDKWKSIKMTNESLGILK
ncbi:MAG: type II glyceraldehyde-3-phosphate dehydrogenase [Candidatus Aenigmarchaeota archaeon]|jgi:glyceraldehyde-3-phosphate dehydrogenase (NAD(P))|nr:type II glyceraldehyde-3-phosphate dehydrogenase [Candidatus Aenigmarchaeota archaeon]